MHVKSPIVLIGHIWGHVWPQKNDNDQTPPYEVTWHRSLAQEAIVLTRAIVLIRNSSVEFAEQFHPKKVRRRIFEKNRSCCIFQGSLKQLCAFFSNNRSLKHRSSRKSACKNGQTENQQLVLRSWHLGSEDNGDYGPVKQKWTSAVSLGKVSIPRVRLLKAFDTIRLWISMFD
jgi:hypothetical protein